MSVSIQISRNFLVEKMFDGTELERDDESNVPVSEDTEKTAVMGESNGHTAKPEAGRACGQGVATERL